MRTELFSRTLMPEDALTRYLAGTVTVDTVAAAIEDRLDKPERANAVIRLPVFTHVARLLNPILALVPSPLIRIASWSSGADWAMMAYGPRPDYGERLEAVRKRAD
jgi:hypothetical protein